MERVTFFNEESGFSVLRVKVRGQREPVTVLGSLPSVSAGEWLTAEGWWVRDKQHGLQFKARVLRTVPPNTSEGVERYLAGGFVKGIGPVLAKKLVGHFGAEVLGVFPAIPLSWSSSMESAQSVESGLPKPGMRECRYERSCFFFTATESVPGERSASTRPMGSRPLRRSTASFIKMLKRFASTLAGGLRYIWEERKNWQQSLSDAGEMERLWLYLPIEPILRLPSIL